MSDGTISFSSPSTMSTVCNPDGNTKLRTVQSPTTFPSHIDSNLVVPPISKSSTPSKANSLTHPKAPPVRVCRGNSSTSTKKLKTRCYLYLYHTCLRRRFAQKCPKETQRGPAPRAYDTLQIPFRYGLCSARALLTCCQTGKDRTKRKRERSQHEPSLPL